MSGPCAWTAIEHKDEPGVWGVYEACEGGNLIVVVEHRLGGKPDPDNKRLAKLIAAAPEMFEALERAAPMVESWADGKSKGHPDHKVAAECRSVIAKAKRGGP